MKQRTLYYTAEVTDPMIRKRYNELLFNIKDAIELGRPDALARARQEIAKVYDELDKRGMRR